MKKKSNLITEIKKQSHTIASCRQKTCLKASFLVYVTSIVTSSNLIVVASRLKISGLQLLSARYIFADGINPFPPVPRG